MDSDIIAEFFCKKCGKRVTYKNTLADRDGLQKRIAKSGLDLKTFTDTFACRACKGVVKGSCTVRQPNTFVVRPRFSTSNIVRPSTEQIVTKIKEYKEKYGVAFINSTSDIKLNDILIDKQDASLFHVKIVEDNKCVGNHFGVRENIVVNNSANWLKLITNK